jgi:hypothetical protein
VAAQEYPAWGAANHDANCHTDCHRHTNLDAVADSDCACLLSAADGGALANLPARAAARYSDLGAISADTGTHAYSVPNAVAYRTGLHACPDHFPDARVCARAAAAVADLSAAAAHLSSTAAYLSAATGHCAAGATATCTTPCASATGTQ